jgi:hypothetical protein
MSTLRDTLGCIELVTHSTDEVSERSLTSQVATQVQRVVALHTYLCRVWLEALLYLLMRVSKLRTSSTKAMRVFSSSHDKYVKNEYKNIRESKS